MEYFKKLSNIKKPLNYIEHVNLFSGFYICDNNDRQIIYEEIFIEDHIVKDNTTLNIIENFTCPLCYDIIFPCVVLYCGHSYCEKCAVKIQHEFKCSLCKNEIIGFSTNYLVNNYIGNFNIHCPNNCGCIVKLCNLKEHTLCCNNQKISCSKCSENMLYKDFDEHKNNVCIYRKEVCALCQEIGPYLNLETHKNNFCIERLIVCSWCKKEHKYKNSIFHGKYKCTHKEIKCIHCDRIITANKFLEHKRICNKYRGYCPCCEKKNIFFPFFQEKMNKHLINCKYYYKIINKYFRMNYFLSKKLLLYYTIYMKSLLTKKDYPHINCII